MIYHRHVDGTFVIQCRHDEKQIDESERDRFSCMGKNRTPMFGMTRTSLWKLHIFGQIKLIAQWFATGEIAPASKLQIGTPFFWRNGRSSWWVWKNSSTSNYVRAEVCERVVIEFIKKHGEHTHVAGNPKCLNPPGCTVRLEAGELMDPSTWFT